MHTECVLQKLKLSLQIIFVSVVTIFIALTSANRSWGAPVNLTGFEIGNLALDVNVSTCTLETDANHSGTYGVTCNPTTTGTESIRFGGVAADGTFTGALSLPNAYIETWFRVNTLPASASEEIMQASDSSISTLKFALRITSAGNLAIYNTSNTLVATGATALSTGVWYRIGVLSTTSASASAYEVRLNGAVELSGTMTQSSANTGFIFIGKTANRNGQTVDYDFDDIYIDNAAFPNNTKILKMAPNANGSTMEWTGGDATCNATPANCYLQVDEIPPDSGTTYVEKSAAASQVALMNFQTAAAAGIDPGVSGYISAVRAWLYGAETGAITSALLCRISSNGVTADTSTYNGNTSYVRQVKVQSTDPNTATAWTTSGLDSMQAGCVDTSANSGVRCSSIGVEVAFNDFTPTPTPTPTNTPTPTPTPTPTQTPTPLPGTGTLLLMGVGN